MTVKTLDSVAYCYVSSLALPSILIPTISTTQVQPPTWASPVSAPESLSATRGHSPTWESPVSVPAFRLPNPPSLSILVPTACHSPPRSSYSYPLAISLPGFPKAVSPSSLDVTRHPSCALPLHTLSLLNTLQIVDVAPPTVPWFPAASLCRSSLTAFPLPPIRLPPQGFPTSRLLTNALASL